MASPFAPETLDAVLARGVAWSRRDHHRAIAVLIVDVDGDADEHTMCAVEKRLGEIWNTAAVRIESQFVIVSTAVRSNFDALSLGKLVARAAPCPVRIGIRVARDGVADRDVLMRDAQYALDEAHRQDVPVIMFNRELCRKRAGVTE
jgi:hypothetical protein